MRRHLRLLLLAVAVPLTVVACKALRSAKPLGDMRDMQRMIAGRLDAQYIGNEACLGACHFHDKLARHFEATTMGASMAAEQGVTQIDCESCHGPGSLAVEGLSPDKVRADAAQGIQTACKHDTLIDFPNLPVTAQNLLCLNCHSTLATFNLHEWSDSAHARGEVACASCHPPHAGPDLIIPFRERSTLCSKCHEATFAEMALPSRHPVREQKMSCTDCHDPHGASAGALVAPTVEETCTRCHGEVMGPFAFEHAEVIRDCTGCHSPHGAMNEALLTISEPALCLRCHSGHFITAPGGGPSGLEQKGAFYTRCTDCHSSIHGTDLPSTRGRGTFTR